MKIIVTNKATYIHDLNVGDVFRDPVDGGYYLIIDEIFREEYQPINAVCLATGMPYFVPYGKEIIPVTATLTVEA